MAVKKVIINGETKIDLTDTTATEEDVAEGKIFFGANGEKIEGKMVSKMSQYGGVFPESIDWWEQDDIQDQGSICEVVIPEGVKHLRKPCILQNGVGGIYKIYLPDSLETIKCDQDSSFSGVSGNYAYFQVYTNNIQVYIEQVLAQYDSNGFDYYQGGYLYFPSFFTKDNQRITEFRIPEGIENIPDYFFGNGQDFTGSMSTDMSYFNLYLPSTIKQIDGSNFESGYLIPQVIEISATQPPTLNSSLGTNHYNNPTATTIIIPQGCLGDYESATNWSALSEYFLEKDSVTNWSFGGEQFTYSGNITWSEYVLSSENNGVFYIGEDGYVYSHGNLLHQRMNNGEYPVMGISYIKSVAYH